MIHCNNCGENFDNNSMVVVNLPYFNLDTGLKVDEVAHYEMQKCPYCDSDDIEECNVCSFDNCINYCDPDKCLCEEHTLQAYDYVTNFMNISCYDKDTDWYDIVCDALEYVTINEQELLIQLLTLYAEDIE